MRRNHIIISTPTDATLQGYPNPESIAAHFDRGNGESGYGVGHPASMLPDITARVAKGHTYEFTSDTLPETRRMVTQALRKVLQ